MSRAPAIACVALAATACSGDPEPRVVHGTAIEHGAALFSDPAVARTSVNSYSCATCHEPEPGDAGDRILPGAPLAGAALRPSFWGGQELDLLRAVNACLYYFMLKDDAWTAEDVEARAVYAYLESLPRDAAGTAPAPFTPVYAVSAPPAGDAARGAVAYNRACASCHGAARTGAGRLVARAPILPDQTLQEHPDGEYTAEERRLVFVEKVRHGGFVGYGGEMPPFSIEKLSDADMGDILAFFGVD